MLVEKSLLGTSCKVRQLDVSLSTDKPIKIKMLSMSDLFHRSSNIFFVLRIEWFFISNKHFSALNVGKNNTSKSGGWLSFQGVGMTEESLSIDCGLHAESKIKCYDMSF